MSQILSTYPIFEGSQVLTSTQLNQLNAYLDQQNRLTRSKLIGIGIVCGLQVQPLSGGLSISKGLGISSEGFLFQMGRRFDATHYRPYQLPESVTYKPFGFPEQDVQLWELLSEKPEDETQVKKLTSPATFLNDKIVLLFLEIFDKDLKSCLGNACDDKGQDRILTLRRLLIKKTDLEKIVPERTAQVSGEFSGALDLPTLYLRLPLFHPEEAPSNNRKDFVENYQKPIQNLIENGFWELLEKGYGTFSPLLAKGFDFQNPFEQESLRSKIEEIQKLVEAEPDEILGIQYFYDFFNELLIAWEEFRQTGTELWYTCPSDPSLFPLHLMLGRAKSTSETSTENKNFRHGFVQPPIFNSQKLLQEKLIQRFRRLVLMIESLEIDLITNGGVEKYPIKITPSKEKYGLLGDRSIPYYYDLTSKGKLGSWYALEKSWGETQNFHLWSTKRAKALSYDNQPDEGSEKGSFYETPLAYQLEQYPFFRIEGHLLQNSNEAAEKIAKVIRQFNLPIHLHQLYLDEGNEENLDRCGWHDLQEEYAHLRLQLVGLVTDIREVLNFVQQIREDIVTENLRKASVEIKEDTGQVFLDRLNETLAECIEDLDWERFQEAYKELLTQAFDFILFKLNVLDRVKIPDDKRDFFLGLYNGLLTRVSPMLYRLLDLFFFSKIQRLYLSYLNRIEQLSYSDKFSNFINENPGIQHQSGVYRGGTFILLYSGKSGNVIGDFSLPGKVCDCNDCLDACENMDWGLLPPFARPDYAITMQNTSILVEVAINDRLAVPRDYEVNLISSQSEQNGKVEQGEDKSRFRYTPEDNFVGIDSFEYKLVDRESGKSDNGMVYILVKEDQKQCYTTAILECLGPDTLVSMASFRDIPTQGNSVAQIAAALLQDLQRTNGFDSSDFGNGPLSNDETKRRLLNCLGIPFTDEKGPELTRLIQTYQAQNCGQAETQCSSTFVEGRVTDPTGKGIRAARVAEEGQDFDAITDEDGGYSLQLSAPGKNIIVTAKGYLEQRRFICSQSTEDFQLTPFTSAQPTTEEVVVDVSILDRKEVIAILDSNKLIYMEEDSDEALKEIFLKSKPDSGLKEEELKLLKNDTLKKVLADKNLEFRSSENKAGLIDILNKSK